MLRAAKHDSPLLRLLTGTTYLTLPADVLPF